MNSLSVQTRKIISLFIIYLLFTIPHTQANPTDLKNYNPVTGNIVGLVVLIEFPDTLQSINHSPSVIDSFFNQNSSAVDGNNGSVNDYFNDISDGNLNYTNIVPPLYCMVAQVRSYYSYVPINRVPELIEEALDCIKAQNLDLSSLTTDANNIIRAVNILVAGNNEGRLWPHASGIPNYTLATNKIVQRYQLMGIQSQIELRPLAHETGHLLGGWPEMYDSNGGSHGLGNFDVMANSSDALNPVPPNPYLRMIAGWLTPTYIPISAGNQNISIDADSNDIYQLTNPNNPHEFFLIQAINQTGRYTAMPDRGLAIWHIDEFASNDNQQMTAGSHYRVSIKQADGFNHLENNVNAGDAQDLFESISGIAFNIHSNPHSRWWSGTPSNISISNISAAGSSMTFTVNTQDFYEQQAEDATYSGGNIVNTHPGYTGIGYFDSNPSASAYVEFAVTAEIAGTYNTKIRFANSSGSTIANILWVNSINKGSLNFPSSLSWTSWNELDVNLKLSEGTNLIRVQAQTSVGTPNLDVISINLLPQITRMENISSQCADVPYESIDDNTGIITWGCGDQANQKWYFKDLNDGYFEISALHSGKCIDVPSGSATTGLPIIQYECNGGNNQKWQKILQPNGRQKLVSLASALCLDVIGNTLVQNTCVATSTQEWLLTEISSL